MISRLARYLLKNIVLNPIVLLVVALICGVIGIAVVYDAPVYAARAARAERLLPLTAAALADSEPGREALVEGQISEDTPVVYRSFVAYVREEYRSQFSLLGGESSERWEVVEQVTPPLVVALTDGEAHIMNGDYQFDTTAFTVREAEPTLTDGAVQSRGYRVGDPALLVGRVVDAGGKRAFEAEFIYAGTRDAYLAEMRGLARRSLPVGGVFILLCIASAVALLWQVRRFVREVAAEQAAAEIETDLQLARKRSQNKRKKGRNT